MYCVHLLHQAEKFLGWIPLWYVGQFHESQDFGDWHWLQPSLVEAPGVIEQQVALEVALTVGP